MWNPWLTVSSHLQITLCLRLNNVRHAAWRSGFHNEWIITSLVWRLKSSRNFIFSTTLASMRGGNGRPVMTTARPLLSEKSRPSLTWGEEQNNWMVGKFYVTVTHIFHWWDYAVAFRPQCYTICSRSVPMASMLTASSFSEGLENKCQILTFWVQISFSV